MNHYSGEGSGPEHTKQIYGVDALKLEIDKGNYVLVRGYNVASLPFFITEYVTIADTVHFRCQTIFDQHFTVTYKQLLNAVNIGTRLKGNSDSGIPVYTNPRKSLEYWINVKVPKIHEANIIMTILEN